MNRRPIVALLVAPLLLVVASACGGDEGGGSGGDRLQVTTAFYPLAFVAEEVGGSHVEVTNLTAPGVEPHDLELGPRQVAQLEKADLLLRLRGFQPAVDDAARTSGVKTLDVAEAADLLPVTETGGEADHDHGHDDEAGTEGDHGHDDEAGTEGDHGHEDEAGTDPHFWLDPTRLEKVAAATAARFAEADPGNAGTYRANARRLAKRLADLDGELRSGLKDCRTRELVTSHTAFGYFARRYGFTPVGIGTLTGAEPAAGRLAKIARLVKEHEVATIYSETLVSPRMARSVAEETGAKVAVLDPIEGLTDDSKGDDYLQVMRSNLKAVEVGQGCR